MAVTAGLVATSPEIHLQSRQALATKRKTAIQEWAAVLMGSAGEAVGVDSDDLRVWAQRLDLIGSIGAGGEADCAPTRPPIESSPWYSRYL